jgi:hypothetical protein
MSALLIITNAVLQMGWLLHGVIIIMSHPASKKLILKVARHRCLGFQRYAMTFTEMSVKPCVTMASKPLRFSNWCAY